MTSISDVRSVANCSSRTSTRSDSIVRGRVLSVHDGGIAPRVYDLTVEGQHEFFADGVLVHNCIDAIRYGLDGYIQRSGDLGMWARLAG